MLRKVKDKKITFASLTRKYWKEQIFFYAIATLSCVLSCSIDGDIKQIVYGSKNGFFSVIGDVRNAGDLKWNEFLIVSLYIAFYFLVVFIHVWYAFYIQSKVRNHLKQVVSEKLFQIKNYTSHDRELVSSILNNNVRSFSEYVFYIPNQLYYVVLDVALKGFSFKMFEKASTPSIKFCFQYLVAILIVCFILQYSFYARELILQGSLKDEAKVELSLAENRDLVIKKNLVSEHLDGYRSSLKKTFQNLNKRDISQTLSFVFPSYFMIKWFPFVGTFLNPVSAVIAIRIFYEIFDNIRKLVERARQYPFFLSSQNKINNFLTRGERDDLQKHSLVTGKVESIVFKGVSFKYENTQKQVLNNFDLTLQAGQLNRLNFPNGFGKSTIISLLVGLIELQQGVIMINHKHSLRDLDLNKWRERIVYSEHKNLVIEENLSTGQKQLLDLENSLNDLEKDVYIFDEADSNLDSLNKELFLTRIEKISKTKVVILVTHATLNDDEAVSSS